MSEMIISPLIKSLTSVSRMREKKVIAVHGKILTHFCLKTNQNCQEDLGQQIFGAFKWPPVFCVVDSGSAALLQIWDWSSSSALL